jgi:hypothetical protein
VETRREIFDRPRPDPQPSRLSAKLTLALVQAKSGDDRFRARRHAAKLIGDVRLFRNGGFLQLPLKDDKLFAPPAAPLDFLLPIADATHVKAPGVKVICFCNTITMKRQRGRNEE